MMRTAVKTLTFLFTDIEGSTRLWEAHPQAMAAALACHDTLLRQAIEAHGGHIFRTAGDAVDAAFTAPQAALATAIAIQRALAAEDWGETGPLRVRAALHTGAVDIVDGEYTGPAINRLSRLVSAGYGGQILLSVATYELVRDDLPDGISLRDLGERRLPDLTRPEHVYQAVAPDLPADFPPLRTLESRPNNLPAQPSPLIGRERELADVEALLMRDNVGLVTLTGPGGTGKTRLGLQVAADLLGQFEHGVFVVNLAAVTDSSLVLPTIAQTLGIREAGRRPAVDVLHDYLRERNMLLMLDNFEQVIDAAPQVAGLVAEAPRLKLLVTSRIVLRIRAEQEYLVLPLALPPRATTDRRPPTTASMADLSPRITDRASRISQYAAVRLFIERARAVKPDFEVTSDNAPAVAEICARLDGLPLAIELAAARVRLLAPEAILQRLDHSLTLLTGGARDLPQRQKTLRDAIAWSYDLLNDDEKTLFRHLGVFVGGFTLDAAEAIAGDSRLEDGDSGQTVSNLQSPISVLDGIDSLVAKSLLTQREDASGEMRFGMLETIREFAAERLAQSDEADLIHLRHACYFETFAQRGAYELVRREQALWAHRVEDEVDNMRAALGWTLDHGRPDIALNTAWELSVFWDLRRDLTQGRRWLTAIRDAIPNPTAEERVKLSIGLALLALRQGDREEAHALTEAARELMDTVTDLRLRALVCRNLGLVALYEGRIPDSLTWHEQAFALFNQSGDAPGAATMRGNIAILYALAGQLDEAEDQARQSIRLAEAAGDMVTSIRATWVLGFAAVLRGDYPRATSLLQDALRRLQPMGERLFTSLSLIGLAAVATRLGQGERAARLFGAEEKLREVVGAVVPAPQVYARFIDELHARYDRGLVERAWSEGRAMNLDEALAYALGES